MNPPMSSAEALKLIKQHNIDLRRTDLNQSTKLIERDDPEFFHGESAEFTYWVSKGSGEVTRTSRQGNTEAEDE